MDLLALQALKITRKPNNNKRNNAIESKHRSKENSFKAAAKVSMSDIYYTTLYFADAHPQWKSI